MNKLLNLIIIVLILALVAVIVYPKWQESKPVKVRFGCDSTVASTVFFVAEDQGFLKDNRIIPEFVFFADPRQALDALFQGEIDCGVFPWHLIFKRIAEKQETVKVFISEDYRSSLPIDALIVKAKSRIKKITDLKKRKIGHPNQIREIMPAMLEGAGLNPKDFTLTEIPNRELLAALQQDKVDAALIIEPEKYRAIQTDVSIIDDAPLAKYIISPLPGAAIGYTGSYLIKNRIACVRLKLAFDAAVGYIDQKPEEARVTLARNLGYSEDEIANCRLPNMLKLVEINKDMIKTLADRLKASGVFTEEIDTKSIFVEPIKLKQ
jgi:ABC-type nitrate/sulfonate/bicarbonate transport system substrate-binding protein